MLSQRIKRLLSKKHIKHLSPLEPSSNINRMYYNDPASIDDLSDFLRQRQLHIQRRKDFDKSTTQSIEFSIEKMTKIFAAKPPPRIKFNGDNFPEWWSSKLKKFRTKDQTKYKERHLVLGYDLAAAHFILYRGGKVKFEGHSDWISPKLYGKLPLPNTYDSKYIVVALDLSNTQIEYEGLVNISGLTWLKWLSFKNSSTINDWTIDKISAEYPNLEYLDISECEGVTARALESLYRAPNLKTLVVTNYNTGPELELSCYMLEDVNPHLECIIHPPQKKSHTGKVD